MELHPEVYDYDDVDEKIKPRLDVLRSLFQEKFEGRSPKFFCRVPGRVNLIGEHVDYCGYPVCPMAIEQDIVIAAGVPPGDGPFLKLVNSDSHQYPDQTIDEKVFRISIEKNGWGAYVLCGVLGVMSKIPPSHEPRRMEMAVSGRVPPGSGLSSSSALVCASLLATSRLNEVVMTKLEMAELSASSERHIGLEGGGMDQAIAFLATKGCAKHIKFNPLRTKDVKLPDEAVFVIGHSLVTKKKAETSEYNTRVVECRIASQIIAKKCGVKEWREIRKVTDAQNLIGLTLNGLTLTINRVLHDKTYTKEEICQELEVTEEELAETSLTPNTLHLKEFKLHARITHVVSESHRVQWWLKEMTLHGLGNLMTASHNSMANLYDASHPECDRLVSAAMNCGAAGARITGAGWGGCVVALTTRSRLPEFLDGLKKAFYSDYEGNIDDVLFPTEPQAGAFVILP